RSSISLDWLSSIFIAPNSPFHECSHVFTFVLWVASRLNSRNRKTYGLVVINKSSVVSPTIQAKVGVSMPRRKCVAPRQYSPTYTAPGSGTRHDELVDVQGLLWCIFRVPKLQ